MLTDCLHYIDIALYDIDPVRLDESYEVISALNNNINEGRATISKYLGVENRKEALRDANFVVNAIQVGGYDPCTIIDFEIPKKYGLRQTIGDTLGIGGIMRALRTIPVLADFARDIEEVCPNAWFLNYSNPMAMLSGYMQRYTKVKTVGLCHSVQSCSRCCLWGVGLGKLEYGSSDLIAGINHMAWLLEVHDKDGNDLYPEIRKRAAEILEEHLESGKFNPDLVRFEYIRRLGYYCTESSEHNAEYGNLFIKDKYPELIKKYHICTYVNDVRPKRLRKKIKFHINDIGVWKHSSASLRPVSKRGSRELLFKLGVLLIWGFPTQNRHRNVVRAS